MDFLVEPTNSLKGEIELPGDKSISHRAIICASIAYGTSRIKGFLESEDCLSTMKAFQEMGVKITRQGSSLVIEGKGLNGLKKPKKPLNMGNSGTSMRLIAGVLASQGFDSVLTGDKSLNRRPMKRITDPLNKFGCSIETKKDGTPPLKIFGVDQVSTINYEIPIASAQVKSCLMFAALYANGTSSIQERNQTRDHTERMFKKFGIPINVLQTDLISTISINPPKQLSPCNIEICSDFSSASFFILAALILPNSHLVIKNVGINKTRIGFLKAIREMGGYIDIKNLKDKFEPTADIVVKTSKLKGISLDPESVSNVIDELPVLFIAAALAKGTTSIRGAEELRYKESDRLESMANSLDSFGVNFDLHHDGIDIVGLNQSSSASISYLPFNKAEIDSSGDHRIAMASAIGALRSQGPCKIRNCENVATSFPAFLDFSSQLGLSIKAV